MPQLFSRSFFYEKIRQKDGAPIFTMAKQKLKIEHIKPSG